MKQPKILSLSNFLGVTGFKVKIEGGELTINKEEIGACLTCYDKTDLAVAQAEHEAGLQGREWITITDLRVWLDRLESEAVDGWANELDRLEAQIIKAAKRCIDGGNLRVFHGLVVAYWPEHDYYNLASIWRSAMFYFQDAEHMAKQSPNVFLRRRSTQRLIQQVQAKVIDSIPGQQAAPYLIATAYCQWLHPALSARILERTR